MFISRDPIGLLGGDNVFAYADNPVMWIDPLGLKKKKTTDFNEWLNRGDNNYSNYISNEYTGITNNFDRRYREHNGTKGDIRLIPNAKNLTKNQARAIEQAIIHHRRNNGNLGLNIRNSVSPKRNIYNDVLSWGENWLLENDPDTARTLGLGNNPPNKPNKSKPPNKGANPCH